MLLCYVYEATDHGTINKSAFVLVDQYSMTTGDVRQPWRKSTLIWYIMYITHADNELQEASQLNNTYLYR